MLIYSVNNCPFQLTNSKDIQKSYGVVEIVGKSKIYNVEPANGHGQFPTFTHIAKSSVHREDNESIELA